MKKLIDNETKLDFKDVLIVPQRSDLDSRSKVDLRRTFRFKHSPLVIEGTGIIAANMDSVGTFAMAKVLGEQKMFTALHKHYKVEELVNFFDSNRSLWKHVFYTIGLKDLNKLLKVKKELDSCRQPPPLFPLLINIDVANGFNQTLISYSKKVRKLFPESVIMVGNIIGQSMTEELLMNGADIVKIGIGSGSACLTRVKTGVGYPQLSAIDESSFAAHGLQGHICSDGGCSRIGDICKAFAAGSDIVMLGGFLSGTDECEGSWLSPHSWGPGEKIEDIPGHERKKSVFKFYGMSSENAQNKHNGGVSDYKTSEGKCVEIRYKGSVKEIIKDICGGLRSCCTYIGADCIKNLPKCACFAKVNQQENTFYNGSH